MTLEVLDPGFLSTVQDLGRAGYERFGVPVSGAMDWFALRAANLLVGNEPGATCLEFAVHGISLYAWHDCLVALAGDFSFSIDGMILPSWMSVFVRKGQTIQILPRNGGAWGYLSIGGGFQTPLVMGSRSTYLRGGFGGLDGRALAAGDLLPATEAPPTAVKLAGRMLPESLRPTYSDAPLVRVIRGPQADSFTQTGWDTLLRSEWQVSATSDRMGYRLEGPMVEHSGPADIISDGIVMGAMQVPSSGQPIVMMSDRQTTGGYTKIAVVISADLPLLAQCPPGSGQVRFKVVTVAEAQSAYRSLMNGLQNGIAGPEDDWTDYSQF